MKKTEFFKKILPFFLGTLLIAAMAAGITGCGGKDGEVVSSTASNSALISSKEVTVLGQGNVKFNFTVTDSNANVRTYQINTDKSIVGEALEELGLIEGEEGAYGIYVKTVDGITLDYNKDGKYWAFYVNGQYASYGVDKTEIKDGAEYSFKAE